MPAAGPPLALDVRISSFAEVLLRPVMPVAAMIILFEETMMMNESRAYRAGVAVAFMTSFLIVWTTIVRDDGQGMGNFGVIMAAAVGAFAAWFRPSGMARTMLAVAVMQMLVGLATATAPITALEPDGVFKAWAFSGVFAALWLLSAAFFRIASKRSAAAPA